MKWVLNTYRTCEDWSVDEIVEICVKTGYQGIEFLIGEPQKHGIGPDASDEFIDTAAAKVHDAGLFRRVIDLRVPLRFRRSR